MFNFKLFRIVIRDIMFLPEWSYATKPVNVTDGNRTNDKTVLKTQVRESLSNILVTHIDFRPPVLDHAELNPVVDKNIEKIPESCIEEFSLYVSTWKGWSGPLPSNNNKVTWEQVERDNIIDGFVTCTPSNRAAAENLEGLYDNGTNSSTEVPPIQIPQSYRY